MDVEGPASETTSSVGSILLYRMKLGRPMRTIHPKTHP